MSQIKRGDLTYKQRLLLGVITARSQFSQEARSRAMQFSHIGQDAESFIAHCEADQHDQVIIDAIFEIADISTCQMKPADEPAKEVAEETASVVHLRQQA